MTDTLDSFQRWFQQVVIAPDIDDCDRITAHINAPHNGTVFDRLAIYQTSYTRRLVTCLTEQFPALSHALGAPLFEDFAMNYLHHCPSQSYTLYDLGKRFPDYLEQQRPDRAAAEADQQIWIDFMIELARFEREIFRMFDAQQSDDVAYTAMTKSDGTMNKDGTALTAHPDQILFESHFPVAEYYNAVKHGKNPAPPPAIHSYYAMLRKNFQTQITKLSADEFQQLNQ